MLLYTLSRLSRFQLSQPMEIVGWGMELPFGVTGTASITRIPLCTGTAVECNDFHDLPP